jgi:hypothetical protein
MPQPVHYSHQIDFEFLPDSLLQRPKLGVLIAIISVSWNEAEARLWAFLAALVGDEANTVISIFLALQSDSGRRAAIETIASLKLTEQEQDEFSDIMNRLGKRYSERNAIVHGAWGISSKYPDKLLWADVRDTTMLHVRMMRFSAPEYAKERKELLIAAQKGLVVYDEVDLTNIIERIRSDYEDLALFSKPFMEKRFGRYAKVDEPIVRPRPDQP